MPRTEKVSLPKKSVLSRPSFIPVPRCQNTWGRTLHGEKLLWPSHPLAVYAAVSWEQGHTSWPIALPCMAHFVPAAQRRFAWAVTCSYLTKPCPRTRLLLCQYLHPVCSSPLLPFTTGRQDLGCKPAFGWAFFPAASIIPEPSCWRTAPEPLWLALVLCWFKLSNQQEAAPRLRCASTAGETAWVCL